MFCICTYLSIILILYLSLNTFGWTLVNRWKHNPNYFCFSVFYIFICIFLFIHHKEYIWTVCFCVQGTAVMPNLTSVLFDKTEWETPDTFNPEHFLDADGKLLRKEAFLPFSAGDRHIWRSLLCGTEILHRHVNTHSCPPQEGVLVLARALPGWSSSCFSSLYFRGFIFRRQQEWSCVQKE